MDDCKFIAIEGPDSCGKATQSELLTGLLHSLGHRAVRVEVPIRDRWTYKPIYWMLKTGLAKVFPIAFQCLQTLNRVLFQRKKLKKLADNNDYIIFDRWLASSWAYGRATNVPEFIVKYLCSKIVHPDYTVILDGAPCVTEERDCYEKDQSLQEKVSLHYLEYTMRCNCCNIVIDANQSKSEVFEDIVMTLLQEGVIAQPEQSRKTEQQVLH